MSSNNEFPIPFEDSRRGLAANQEEKAAVGRLGQYLASRGVNRPTIGEGRKRRRLGNIELPTGGKPGKRKPTGSRMDVDGDGWADEGTTKPVWVGIDGQGKKPKQGAVGPKISSGKEVSVNFKKGFLKDSGTVWSTDKETGKVIGALSFIGPYIERVYVRPDSRRKGIAASLYNEAKKHNGNVEMRSDDYTESGAQFMSAMTGRQVSQQGDISSGGGEWAQWLNDLESPSSTRLSSGMTQLSEVEVYDYGNLKAAKKVRSTQPKGKEEDYWIVLDKDGEVRAYLASAVDETRKKLLDNFNQQGENPFNGKKSPLSIDDIDMQDALRSALGDKKMKIIAALETWYVEDRNEVFQINTRGGHRRRGIAAEMFNTHREVFPERDLQHSDALSEDGKAFSAATPSSGRLSSGAIRRVGSRNVYDKSVDYHDKRNPSGLLETSRDGKEYSSIRFNGDGYDIKTSQSEDGFSVFIEDESGQIASLVFSEAPTGEATKLLSYKASKESQKAGVLEALLDHVLVKNPDTNITSTAETRRWLQYVNNGTADYGVKGFRKYGFSGKYIDGEDVLRDGDYTLESDLLLKTSNVSSSPVKVETFSSFSKNEYIWEGQVYKIGNESIVFGAHEQAEFGDGIKKLPLNPFEILKLDPSSAEGRKAAARWYAAVHGAAVSVLAESSDFNASSYVSALLYAASKGDKDAQKEFDEFAKYSDSLLEKIDSKLPPIENPEKALSLDSRLVHQTSYKPTIDEKGYLVLRPLEDFPQTAKDGTEVTVNRTTLHFAVNHLAEGHLFRKETVGESYVVVASLDSFVKENPDSLENFNIVDTAASPPPGDGLRFPPGSYKLVEIKNGEDGRKKVEDILRADGVEVLAGGERNSGTPGADEAGRIRARMLGVSPSVASDLTLANLEQVNRTNISDQRQYSDVPSGTSFFQEASKNALLRIANRKENTWVSTSRKLNDKDPLGDSKFRLASGKAPRYPREPTLGAFLEGAAERFDGVNSWEEFKERYNDTEMVFLDYETTGLDFDEFGKATTNGNPTQIGLVRMKNGKEIGRLNLFMNPEQPLGEWSLANLKDADGNPITNEWLATQMPMAEAHRQVAEFIGPNAIIGVQNATFDKRVLEDALEREGIDWRPSGYLDTRDISAMTLPVWSEESPEGPYVTDRDGNKKPSSSLAAITEYLDVELGDGHHNADADAFATSQVMQKIIDRAIENGWSTDVLDREKRDSKLKADNDKFNADVEKFESDKEAFVAAQKEDGSARLSSGAWVPEKFEISIDEVIKISKGRSAAEAPQARDSQKRQIIILPKAENVTDNRYSVYAQLEIEGGNKFKPGQPTGRIVITGDGVDTARPIENPDGSTSQNNPPGNRDSNGGIYREAIEAAITNLGLQDKVKPIKNAESRSRADAKRRPFDGFIIEGATLEESAEILNQLGKELLSEAKERLSEIKRRLATQNIYRFNNERSRETSEANTVVELSDIFKRPLRPIRRSRPTEKLTSTEARLISEDALYDEAYGPIQRDSRRGTRMPSVRGVGETEYDAMLEMVDLGRRKKKLRKASFSYGPDEFERTLQWTEDNADREVDIKIMSQELEVPLSNAYFFINEFPEIFERLKSEKKGRQKYRIRTSQEIKDYSEESSRLSSGRISDNEKTSYKIKNNARNYLLNQEERPIGLMSEYRARYEYYDGFGYAGRRLGSRDENGFNQEAFEQASEDVFGKRFDTFEEMAKEINRLQDLFKEDENYREKIKQESIEKHGYAYSPIYKNGELTANVSIDVYDDELAYNSLYNLLLYMQRGRDGQTATRNTLKKLLKDIEESNEKKNRRFKLVYDENGSRYKLRTFNADLKKLESEELGRLRDKYQEEGMSLYDAINRAISDLKNDERFSDDKMYLDDGNQSLSSGANVVEAFNEPIEVTQQEAADIGLTRESLTGKKIAERIIKKIEETTGIELTKQQKYSIEDTIPGLTREIAGKTLLDVEIDDAFSETGKQLLESISIDISSDGIPFVSADPIPQLAEQIPDKRDWRTVELPKRDDIDLILDEAMKDVVVFDGSVWKDSDGNIVARKIYKNDASTLEFESDEARERFPLLEMIAPKGFVIKGDSISLPALSQDLLPEPYLKAWKKHSEFIRELSRRAGELMGDEEYFLPNSRIMTSTDTYLRGYIGGITDPHKFNMGLYGKALQDSHDLFGHLGTGRAFDRHGEWANDLAMMSIADHPDSPLTPQEKMAVKHLHYMMYSAERMLKIGRLDEYDLNMNETMNYRTRPRRVFDIGSMSDTETRVYAGDFNSVIKKLDAASTTGRLSSGRKPIYEANEEDIELALAHDILGKNDRLASGRQREMIPMNVPSKKREGAGATGYGTQGSLGKIVRRDSSTWLSGLDSDEISRVIIPTNAEEYFEMWADDIAGPTWRTDKNRETFIKKYYAELQKDSTNIPVDYSPESIAATQKLVKDLLDSSPSVMWVMQNFGAPLIVPFTREGMDAYENSPDMKERLALLAKQRGTEKIPFVSGLANRSLGSIGISPRALIDRESLLNDDKGVYPISFDPDRVPAPRDAHIDRSLEGTLVHEFGHWIHHRALWDTETNGASGKMRSYYGTGKLSDPRYVASLDVAEEYGDYETDDKRIEIYSQFIDLTGRSPEEMFRAHPDEPLLSTSYGNINKREAMAEAFVAIMHPNKEMPEKTLSKKLRKDIYTLIGVDEKDLPWSDSETASETRLSSGSKKSKRKNIFSRFRKEETEEETVEETVEEAVEKTVEKKRKPPVVERPVGLVSFTSGPSEELLKALPVPDEQTLKDEVLKDVQSLALTFEKFQEPELFGSGARASAIAKKTIAENLSLSVGFDVEDFIEVFATDEAGYGFHTTETFAAVQKIYKTLKSLPADATDKERAAAARAAFDTKSGRIIAAKIHDDILGRARYYDEILDKLGAEEFDEIFGSPSFAELIAIDGGEKSLFTPYLMTKLGTDDIKREFLEELNPRRHVLNNLISEIKEDESKAFGFARIGKINPETGEQDYELISFLGRAVDNNIIDAISSLEISGGGIRLGQNLADVLSAFNNHISGQKLIQIREAGLTKIDSSNIDSPEIQKLIKEHLIANVRSRAGNYESKLESYSKETGVVFLDVETTEGKRIIREALVSDLIHTWAISANNSNPVALAIQHEIRKMFGLDEAVGWSTSPLGARRLDEKEGMPAHEFDGAPELNDAQSAMIKLVLQKIYDSTQLYYKTKGITHIPVYRGFTQTDTQLLPGEIESMDTTMRPLSSWATSMGIAHSFSAAYKTGVGTPTLIKAFVPVEDVFSNALTGFGCLNEDEVVLFGKPMRVLAVRTDSIQPEFLGTPENPGLLEKLKDVNITNIDKAFESIAQRKETILDNSDKIEELFNSGSDLRGMDLSNTLLDDKKLAGANLAGANLQYSRLNRIDLSNSDLTGAVLEDTSLFMANLSGANLTGAELARASMLQANLSGANLTGANLTGASMMEANLTGANLTGANLADVKLGGANLSGANLERAKLPDVNMFQANLEGANLNLAWLNSAQMQDANLKNVDFTDANLSLANLIGANLSGAIFKGTNLQGALLRGANMEGADLSGANLDGVNLDGVNLEGAILPEGYSVQKLSSGKKSYTPKWKTVEEIVDFEVLGASPDDSEEDRDDIAKESVGGDWMQWDPCREIRTAAYELAGIDEYSERDPNISQSGGFFGNSKFQTTVSPEKRTEQARYLMASVIDSLINGRKYDRQPYLYRAMMFSSPEEGKQFFDAMQVGSQVDIPLLAFVEIGPSPRGDHFLTRFGSDALLVLEDFPGSYQTGGTFEPVFSNRHESDTLYNINEFAEAILADIENGEVDEENAEYDKEFADKLIKLVEDYREAKTPLEKSNIKIDIEEALDEVGNETIKREWEGEPLPEDHEEYYDAMDDEDAGMTPREFVSGGRLEVVSVKPDESKAYRQIITLRQVGAFDPQEKGALVLKTDGENSTRLSSGKKPVKKAKPKSVQLHDDEFEKKFNQEVPDGDGDCFSEAVQQARKLAEAYDKVKIVHGYPLGTGGEAEGLRFPHAWTEFERDGLVWVRDYSNGNRIEFPQILYYGIGNIEEDDVSRYDIKEAEANMIENEHYGPW